MERENPDIVYLDMAKNAARLSKDKNTHVGSVIIDRTGATVSTGRNGTVAGLNDDAIPHSREVETIHYFENDVKVEFDSNKYPFMLHAEENALFYGDKNKMEGATIYVTGMPCPRCALKIAQHKIGRVVIPEDWNNIKMITEGDINLTKFIFSQAGIKFQIHDTLVDLVSEKRNSPESFFNGGVMPC